MPRYTLILRHDVEDRLVDQFRAMPGTTVLHVWLAFRVDDSPWHPQADDSIDGAAAIGVLSVVLHHRHVVAEESPLIVHA